MPLNTQIVRDGETVSLRWSHFHVTAMIYAVAFERDLSAPNDNVDYPDEPQGLSPENIMRATNYPTIQDVCPTGEYTLKKEHHFADIIDGETLKLERGDKLIFFRTSK